MIRVLVHVILATILATSVYYAVKNFKHLKSVNENEPDANVVVENIFNVEEIVEESVDEVRNTTPVNQLPEEELFQPDIDIVHMIPEENLVNNVIADRFVVITMIARGRVGTVWKGFDQVTNSDIAMKFAEPGVNSEILEVEYQNYLELGAEDRAVTNSGIPQVLYFGNYGGYKVLVTSLLGKTLRELKESTPKNKFSLNTILKIAMQMIDILKYVHSRGLLLSNIRSTNLAIGHTEETLNKIFALDFASCIKITSETRPVDDLLAIGFVLMELNGVKFPPLQGVEEHRDVDEIIESLLSNWNKAYVNDLCTQSEDDELFESYFDFLKSLGPKTNINLDDFKEYFEESLPEDARNTNLEIFEQI